MARTLCPDCGAVLDGAALERRVRFKGRGGIVLCTPCRDQHRYEKVAADVALEFGDYSSSVEEWTDEDAFDYFVNLGMKGEE